MASWHESDGMQADHQFQLKEVNGTSVEQTTHRLPLCGAAVGASLAQPSLLLLLGWPPLPCHGIDNKTLDIKMKLIISEKPIIKGGLKWVVTFCHNPPF